MTFIKKGFFFGVCVLTVVGCKMNLKDGTTTTIKPGNFPSTCAAQSFSAQSWANVGSYTSNTMNVTVNGSTCGGNAAQYINEPCVAVTICAPDNPTNCQTIDNILLDTGSFGLRIFSSVIQVPLKPITANGSALAECVQFGGGTSEWGPVQYAYVGLAGEQKVGIPIHTIDATYGSPPGPCSSSQSVPDINPAGTGFNGILGVGLLHEDCGTDCASNSNNGQYYTCKNGDCSCGASVALGAQVQNPIGNLLTNNNGLILQLAAVAAGGSASASGTLTLGIDTQANNVATGTTAYQASNNLTLSTQFTNYSNSYVPAFIDSGTNMVVLPTPTDNSLPDCSVIHGSSWKNLFCPNSLANFTVTNQSATGVSGSLGFSVDNGYNLIQSNNKVLPNLGLSSGSKHYFAWGLPFFLGKSVYIGINGRSSTIGSGAYWAF